MPGINQPSSNWLSDQLSRQAWTLRALAHQQNYTCSTPEGQPVVNMGLIPGSDPAMYGLQVLNPASGEVVGQFVLNTDTGLVAQQYYNASGQLGCQIDAAGTHYYDTNGTLRLQIDQNGLHQFDASGNQLLLVGTQLNGEDGLGVLSPSGAIQRGAGVQTSAAGSLSNTTVASWTVPNGASTVTADIGPSGSALVSVSGQCSTGTGGQEAFIGCQVDGVTVPVAATVASGAGGVTLSTSATLVVANLTPNTTHTFEPVVSTAANGSSTCTFQQVTVTVTPL